MQTCDKCGQEVVKRRYFWVLPSEVTAERVTYCPEGGQHEVETDEDDD